MVANADGESYSPFQHPIPSEDGPQSSEEGSGLHSPVFGALTVHDDTFRYHEDRATVRHSGSVVTTQYNYAPPLDAREHSIVDTKLEIHSPVIPSPSFRSDFSINSRNQPSFGFPVQSHISTAANQSNPSFDFRYSPTYERRLPGGPPYDQTYLRQNGDVTAAGMDDSHGQTSVSPISPTERAEPSNTAPSSTSRGSRREASTVVIACRQCRGRKIRCDSTRPYCNNCVRRSNVCEYDSTPKRRGPDKHPGTRKRTCKKRPVDSSSAPSRKRKRGEALDIPLEVSLKRGSIPDPTSRPSRVRDQHGSLSPIGMLSEQSTEMDASPVSASYRTTKFKPSDKLHLDLTSLVRFHGQQQFVSPISPIAENWWDDFIQTYPVEQVADDLAYLFSETGHWLSFLDVAHFMKHLWDPQERSRIQPSFILAALAMSLLIRSNELEDGAEGRQRAQWLHNEAKQQLKKALRVDHFELSLAQAALILALYEFSAHPNYDSAGIPPILSLLDRIIHKLGLTSIDASDADVCKFPPHAVPVVLVSTNSRLATKCSCIPPNAPHAPDGFTSWSYSVPWDSNWSSDMVYQEECRRLCWIALGLVANYTAQCAALNRRAPELFLTDPSSWSLLFPGEVADRASVAYRASDSHSPKESVWGLYCRSMLLWVFCDRMLYDATGEDKAEFSHEAWNESQSILDSLNMHDCNLDTILIYMSREYVYNSRMAVTQALRSLQGLPSGPYFNRKQAEEWIFYQEQVVKRVNLSLHPAGVRGHSLTRRPWDISWYLCQLMICLNLWRNDQTLVGALELAKALLVPVELMNTLWPCPPHKQQTEELRNEVVRNCAIVGLEPPQMAPTILPIMPAQL